MRIALHALLMMALLALAACGNKGALVLPDKSPAPAAKPAPATASSSTADGPAAPASPRG